ncbi:response regulator [Allomuricauda sp. F6463D]|uniref:response regulator n=1 Tax=Allomuricauda sp. F6463D TaxID=2926409 RepID=UPI001FF1954E|nr:response regulator [Muricauda sp. F6463D]MCK0159169.1 response regulator [Muricauda sp. F6463D]
MNIFLADDDEDDRLFFVEALEEIPLDIETSEFSNGVGLMRNLYSDEKLPDVIFLDLNMPMMNGFECLSDIRNDEKFKKLPVVIYSTSFHEEEVERLKNMGATGYLRKPTSYNQLKTLVYKCLKNVKDWQTNNENNSWNFIIFD